jgi:hypothetical protein
MLTAAALFPPIHRTKGAGPNFYPRSRAHAPDNYGSTLYTQAIQPYPTHLPHASAAWPLAVAQSGPRQRLPCMTMPTARGGDARRPRRYREAPPRPRRAALAQAQDVRECVVDLDHFVSS